MTAPVRSAQSHTHPTATHPRLGAETPVRIQLRRTKGWKKPEGAIRVSRPTKWGNPFPVGGGWIAWTAIALGYRADMPGRRAAAVALHRAWLLGTPIDLGPSAGDLTGPVIEFANGHALTMGEHARSIAAVAAGLHEPPVLPERPSLEELRGHDLACWCSLDAPCHADVLLEIANG